MASDSINEIVNPKAIEDLENLGIELKSLKKDFEELIGSMEQMSLKLGKLRDLYRDLTDEERENAETGGVLREAINRLDEEMKGLDKTIGNNQRNVGNYEVALASLGVQSNSVGGKLLQMGKKAQETGVSFGTVLVNSLKSVGKAMLALLANPFMLALAGVSIIIAVDYTHEFPNDITFIKLEISSIGVLIADILPEYVHINDDLKYNV